MVLESLESETPNIKDLSVESQTNSELLFDPKKEITSEDWQQMVDQLEIVHQDIHLVRSASSDPDQTTGYQHYYEYAAKMKILSPERFVNDRFPSSDLINFKETLAKHPVDLSCCYLGYAKVLDPDSIKTDEFIKSNTMDYALLQERVLSVIDRTMAWAARLKMLDPDKDIAGDLDLDSDQFFEKLERHLEIARNQYLEGMRDASLAREGIIDFFSYAAYVKLLLPARDIKALITTEDWQNARTKLDKLRTRGINRRPFADLAFYMTILSAKSVAITDRGLEVDMGDQQNLERSSPPLPEVRQF